jgi:hypothetical protein
MGATSSTPQFQPSSYPQMPVVATTVAPGMSTTSSILLGLFVGFLVIIVVYAAYRSLYSTTKTVDQAPIPISGKTGGTIPGKGIPLNPGSDYSLQFWMFVQDWDYRFGQEKEVLMRVDPTSSSIVSPRITLHPTDNTLNVYMTTFASNSTSTSQSQPAAANGSNSDGSVFVTAIENIPLQTWFSVSVTVFQRNMDVFINGNLVKSAVIPAVPRSATGNLLVGANGGFSGYVCSVHGKGGQLMPSEARSFYGAGTSCSSLVNSGGSTSPTGTEYNLFGYTIIIQDASGNAIGSTAALTNGSITTWNPFSQRAEAAPTPALCPVNTWSTSGYDTDGAGTGCKACPSGSTAAAPGATGCACPTGKTWNATSGTCS